jgi:hypothetical protein
MRQLIRAGPWGAYVWPSGRFLTYQMDPWWLPEGHYEIMADHRARIIRFVLTEPRGEDEVVETLASYVAV